MQVKHSNMDTHRQKLILPGYGEVQYKLPPGSIEIPFERAPSGHLVMVVDNCEKVQPPRDVRPRKVHFTTFPKDTWLPAIRERQRARVDLEDIRMFQDARSLHFERVERDEERPLAVLNSGAVMRVRVELRRTAEPDI